MEHKSLDWLTIRFVQSIIRVQIFLDDLSVNIEIMRKLAFGSFIAAPRLEERA